MRLGQLSRKLDIKPTDIREFIRNEFKVEIDLDLNTRLEDSHAEAVEKKYAPVAVIPKPIAEKIKPEFKTSNIVVEEKAVEEKTEETVHHHHELHTPIEIPHYHEATHHGDSNHDSNLQHENKSGIDPFIPLPVDPDAEVIKVPKIKLEGLKVIGKIELPGKKEKPVEEISELPVENSVEAESMSMEGISTETISEIKPTPEAKTEKKEFRKKTVEVVSDEDYENSIYKDKRGIYHFSQTQRENRKNSLERLKREKQESTKKKNKAQHYQQVVVKEKKSESPAVKTKKQTQRESKSQPEKVIRKGLWGKFLNWLNG